MKQVIGHRGAAGQALENSKVAIQQALKQPKVTLEIDVRLTSDQKLVVCHDADLVKMANNTSKIADHTWNELKKLTLVDGSHLLLLNDALTLIGNRRVLVEAKDLGSEHALNKVLKAFPKANATVISFKRPVLLALKELLPQQSMYVSEHHDAVNAIHFAKRHELHGVSLNFWLLSPHIYWLCRRANLEVFVYTVNNRLLFWFLHKLYPHAAICTDYPNRFKN